MARLRWTQVLRSLGVEFWLLLPLLGLGFWFVSGILTDRMLARSDETTLYLEGDHHPKQHSPRTVQAITVVINSQQKTSTVTIQTIDSALKKLLFEFPTAVPEQIEAAISQELGLPRDRVRALIQYQAN